MHLLLATRLAWSNTIDDPQRLFVRCGGITFAVVLIFMQTGFRNALFDSNVRLVERIDADFVIRSKTRYMLSSGQLMSLQEVVKARGCPGVAEVQPIYIENVASYLRKYGTFARRLRVVAFDVNSEMVRRFGLEDKVHRLNSAGTAVADLKSKSIFDFDATQPNRPGKAFGELANKQLTLVGFFELGIDFSNDGNMIMTPRNFVEYFPQRGSGDPLSVVDYGIVRCTAAADRGMVLEWLRRELGTNVLVDSKTDFIKSERNFWGKNTPIGLIFLVGTIIGFVVGMIICYQVLATDIGDHMSEFATIKAMGYPTVFFAEVVVCQALFLSLLSFLPGMLIALFAFEVVNLFTGLVMFLNFPRISLVLGLTVLMCVISGMIALRKLLSTDPASLF